MPCNQIDYLTAIRTANSIIVVIAVSHFTSLTELWVGVGSGKLFQTISILAIAKTTWSSKVDLTSTLLP